MQTTIKAKTIWAEPISLPSVEMNLRFVPRIRIRSSDIAFQYDIGRQSQMVLKLFGLAKVVYKKHPKSKNPTKPRLG